MLTSIGGDEKKPRIIIFDFSQFSIKSGWNNVTVFAHRVLGLGLFVVICTIQIPVWMPGQSYPGEPPTAELNRHDRALEVLKTVPEQLVHIEDKQDSQARDINGVREDVRDLKSTGLSILLALLGALAMFLLYLFGGKVFGVRKGE